MKGAQEKSGAWIYFPPSFHTIDRRWPRSIQLRASIRREEASCERCACVGLFVVEVGHGTRGEGRVLWSDAPVPKVSDVLFICRDSQNGKKEPPSPPALQQDSPHSAKDAIYSSKIFWGGIFQDVGAWRGKNCFHVVFTL